MAIPWGRSHAAAHGGIELERSAGIYLADAVAVVIGDPNIAVLIGSNARGSIAAAVVIGHRGAVGGDFSDRQQAALVGNPCVMAGIDSERNRKR